jgi:hypothetical protein
MDWQVTVLPDIPEIEYWGIYDRAIPNKERIVFKPVVGLDLLKYVVVVGHRTSQGAIQPFIDGVFFFPEVVVEPPTWVFIFTSGGKATISVEQTTKEPVHQLYWGRRETVFNHPTITAVIMRLDGILFPPNSGKQIDAKLHRQLTYGK